MQMERKLAAVAVLAAVGVGVPIYALGGIGTRAADAPEYLTTTATRGSVTDDIAATGSLAPSRRTGVAFGLDPFLADGQDAPQSPGTYHVTGVDVEVGDRVAVGDPLATAATEGLERQLAAARNDLRSARVSLRAAEDDLEDAEDADLTAQLRQAKIALYAAENRVTEAETTVEDLEAQLDGATLTAPVAGVVSEVHVAAGFDAPAGAAVVIDATTFSVTTDVVESDLMDVEIGQTAAVTVDALEETLTGTVTGISPVASEDSGSGVVAYPVTVTLDRAPDTLRSGMSADVTITIATAEDVITVPSAALQGREGAYSVLTLGPDGTPSPTPVQVGLVTNTLAEITSGLAEGTAVVTGTASDLLGTTAQDGVRGGAFAVPIGGGPRGGDGSRPDVIIESRP